MGFFGDAANRVRSWVRRDKEQTALAFAKGSTASGYPTTGYDLLQAYGYDVLSDYLKLEQDLMSRYVDYEEMCEHPLLSTAVEIFADDATQHDNTTGHTVWMSSSDKTIEEVGNDLLHKRLRMDEDIWSIASTMGAYGNDFEEILVNDQGVVGLNYLAPPTVRRIEGPRGELYGFVQDFKGRFGYTPAEYQQIMASRNAMRMGAQTAGNTMAGMERITALEDWEVVHFRIHGRQRRSIYGKSVLESGRFIWKRLVLLEDAAIIYRLQRAPERYAFYVDIGDLPPQEALAYLNRVRQQHKKQKFLNPTTGRLDLKHRPMDQQDDFFVPVRQGAEGTRIEVLGSPSWQAMEDIQYFRDQLFAAIKIPKAYLAEAQGVNRGTLSSEDVRFARSVLRIQRELKNGLSKIMRVHLAALNIDPAQVDYTVHMTVPSAIFELAQLEVQNARADLAARMDPFIDKYYILSKIFKLSDEEIESVMKGRDADAERDANIMARSQSIIQQAVTAAGMQGQAQGQIDMTQTMNAAGMQTPDQQAQTAQAQQMQMAQQQHVAQLRQAAKPTPKRESSIGGPLIIVRDGVRPREYYGLERDLFAGGKRGAEQRLDEKLDKLMRSDRRLHDQLHQLSGLMKDLSATSRNSRR